MKSNGKKVINKIPFILIIVGILVCLYPLYTNLKSYYEQTQLEKELAGQIAVIEETGTGEATGTESPVVENSVTEGNTPAPAKPVASPRPKALMRLEIPDIRISAIVVSGTSQWSLAYGPGWYEQSALPGEGNTAIAGHKNMYGSWFRNVHKLQPGSLIYITYNSKKYTYSVEKVFPIVTNDWSVISRTEEPVLTLTTCYSDTERMACRAALKEVKEI